MSWRPHPRMAETDASNPRGWGTCQRCGFIGNLADFQWNMQWRGTRLMNTNLLVCVPCLDVPQRQLGTLILPPDPPSIANARPEQYAMDEAGFIMFEANTPYPGAPADVRAEGEPIYTEDSDQENQIAIGLEPGMYYLTTPQS